MLYIHWSSVLNASHYKIKDMINNMNQSAHQHSMLSHTINDSNLLTIYLVQQMADQH